MNGQVEKRNCLRLVLSVVAPIGINHEEKEVSGVVNLLVKYNLNRYSNYPANTK